MLVFCIQGTLLHQPAASCYHRTAFEAINMADADFASDSHTSTLRYNSGFSAAKNSSLGRPIDDINCYLSHSENINRGSEIRVRNDTGIDTDWPQNLTSMYHNHSRTEVNELEQRSYLPAQNTNYCDEINFQRSMDHTDFHWQKVAVHNGSDTSATTKLNVSGVFSSLNEYLNAGKVEAKFGDVNIISNQTSWNPARHSQNEAEENGNYAVNHTDTAILGAKTNYENGSRVLYPSINTVTEMQVQVSGGQNMTDDFQENSHSDDLSLTSDQWENAVDVCSKGESNIQSSFADLIPVTYSGSVREEANISGLSITGVHAPSDETPDLLDTAVSSIKSDSFSNSKLLGCQVKDGSHFSIVNSDTSASKFSSVITSISDLQNSSSKDEQSNLMLLPDVATPGRNVLKTSSIVVSASSDLVTSHGSGVLSDFEQSDFNKTALDLVNHKTEMNENLVTSPLLDSYKIVSAKESDAFKTSVPSADSAEGTENISVDMPQVHINQDFALNKSVTAKLDDTSVPSLVELESSLCSNILFDEGNTEVKENGDTSDTSRNLIPVGFNAVEVSDSELHQYLQEMEDNDRESETVDMMAYKMETGISLSSECQDSSVSNCGIDSNNELPDRIYKAEDRRHDENFKSVSSSTEIIGTENETVNKGDLPEDFREGKSSRICPTVATELPKYSTSHESSLHCQYISCESNLPDNESKNITESLSSVTDKPTENIKELPATPGITPADKPETVHQQSVMSSAMKVDTSTVPIVIANISLSRAPDSNPQAVQPILNATPVTSKTSSVITNLVSIDCQKITQSNDQGGSENDRCVTHCSETSKGVEDVREEIEVNKLETKTPNLVTTEMKSPDTLERVLDSKKIEHGMLPIKNESSSSVNSLLSNQVTNFDSAENSLNTPEIILPSDKINSFEKAPSELVLLSENEMSHPSIVEILPKKDTSHEHSDKKNVMGVSEVGFSEVQSCLVRTPRDGTTINVLGEEERPSRPKYLFLPSKITVENEQEDSEDSDESPPVTGAVGK